MLNTSDEASSILTNSIRNIKPRVVIDLIDPDLAVGTVTTSGEMSYSRQDQLHDKVLLANKYMTTEFNRVALDGTFGGFPENAAAVTNEIGVVLDELSGDDGTFSGTPYVEMDISGVGVLQTSSVVFPGNYADGYAVDFDIEIYSGVTLAYSESVTDNSDFIVQFEGFTVYSPTKIKVIFSKWSLPGRYPRVTEILPGSYEDWDGSTIHMTDVLQQADFSCMSLPYGTATLEIYNENNRFDPRNKNGLFASLEDRQSIAFYTAVLLADETYEYIPNGVYYMRPDGWDKSSDDLIFIFKLIDIVGLLRDRKFNLSGSPPTTCEGWIAAIVAQLGPIFEDKYEVDSSIASTLMTCSSDDVANVTCGDLLRWVCMYVGAYPRACSESGCLLVEPVSADVLGSVDGGNMNDYPVQSANDDISTINFRLNDGSNTPYEIAGTKTAASKTLNIANPFITDTAGADALARSIIRYYGGQIFDITGRGNPGHEVGDMVIMDLGLNAFAAGRVRKQQFKIDSHGHMRDVKSTILQASGDNVYKTYVVITEDGDFTVPADVTSIDIVLVGGGNAGQDGTDGTLTSTGTPGAGGDGGKILISTISVTPLATLSGAIGAGGIAPGGVGTATTFAGYSSDSGTSLNGWSDFTIGVVYGKDGLDGLPEQYTPKNGAAGLTNTGNGGGGGSGGRAAAYATGYNTGIVGYTTVEVPSPGEPIYDQIPVFGSVPYTYVATPPSFGGDGANGGSGAIIISYEVAP